MSETKPTNPKDIVGSDKLPLHLWPETATAVGCLGLLDGALKYGRANWREAGVKASIYFDAVRRHVIAWFEGEENDPDSGLPHLSHALACLAIIVDAEAHGKLVDDRNYGDLGDWRALVEKLTPHVKRLKQKHADKKVKHFTRSTPTVTLQEIADIINETRAQCGVLTGCCTPEGESQAPCTRPRGHTRDAHCAGITE